MIISGGENVYPAEVESVLYGHPAVAEAAVIGAPDARWGETVMAVVALKPGHALTLEALQDFAGTRRRATDPAPARTGAGAAAQPDRQDPRSSCARPSRKAEDAAGLRDEAQGVMATFSTPSRWLPKSS